MLQKKFQTIQETKKVQPHEWDQSPINAYSPRKSPERNQYSPRKSPQKDSQQRPSLISFGGPHRRTISNLTDQSQRSNAAATAIKAL